MMKKDKSKAPVQSELPVYIELPLFLKPEDEFGKVDFANPVKGRRAIVDLCDHLMAVADAVEKLRKDGWTIVLGMYELSCFPDKYYTKAEAKKRLGQLGISPSLGDIREMEVEEAEDFGEDA
jgi:hypothetical protein